MKLGNLNQYFHAEILVDSIYKAIIIPIHNIQKPKAILVKIITLEISRKNLLGTCLGGSPWAISGNSMKSCISKAKSF